MEGDSSDIFEDHSVSAVRMMGRALSKLGGPAVIPSVARNLALLRGNHRTKNQGEIPRYARNDSVG